MADPFDLNDDGPPNASPLPWLAALNPDQRLAVETTEGPLLVLSGAGTGKTRVLTARLAQILSSQLARPWQILSVTFTNKAAREMRERVTQLVGPAAEQLWLGTFHALAARILRQHAPLVGLQSNFTILDTDDQLRLLKQILTAEGMDVKKWPPQTVMGLIQRWKDRGLAPSRIGNEAKNQMGGAAGGIYRHYQDRLVALNACDFGDLLLHCLTIFQDPNNLDLLADYQQRFHYILVDEYQDTNVAQYLWLRLLAQKHRNICCVGDDDQSIYSWRGAEVGNILRFDQDFPGSKIVRLEANYRSTPAILAAAAQLISHNQGRLGKTLRPGRADAEAGDPVRVKSLWDGAEEARWVVEEIEALQRGGIALGQMAILVRAGFQTREFEERLITTGLAYKVVGGLRFYERQEIRDALAYFRLVTQPSDDLAFERIFNLPKRGLGDASLQTLHRLARHQDCSLLEAGRRLIETDELTPRARTALRRLIADFARWRALQGSLPHGELAQTILDESGYVGMWRAEQTPDAQGRVENLKELVSALEEFDSLGSFLEHVSLVMDNDEKSDAERLNIMTLHAAKGMEYDAVFLPGWEEGVFPHQRALAEGGGKALEEERRLAYVGLTRARRRVFISHAASRRIYNQWQNSLPSRFITELPQAAGNSRVESFRQPAPAWRKDQGTEIASPSTANSGGTFKLRDRVFHQKFGYGRVTGVDGNKLEISFDKAGDKKLLDSFVIPADQL